MNFLLLVLILVVAAAGGFLGELLEFAGWLILIMVLIGAGIGFLIYRWIDRMKARTGS